MTTYAVTPTSNIGAVTSNAKAGDTISFGAGTYNVGTTITLKSGVSYVGNSGAILNSTSSNDIMFGNGVSNVTVTGLTFSGGPNVVDSAHGAIHLIDVNNVTVSNNSFQNINADAAILFYQSDNVSITNNTGTSLREFVSAINNSGAHGNIVVSGNTLLNTSRMGVEMQGSYSHLAVNNNSMTNTSSIGISLVGGQAATDVSVKGNTLSGGLTAIETSDANMTVTGNVISNMVGGMSIANTPGSVFYNNSFTGVSIPFGEDGGYTGLMSVGSNVINGAAVSGWAGHPNAGIIPSSILAGGDTLSLQVSEDAWQGDAQFTISINGQQVGGVQTATASHAASQAQTFDVLAGFAPGSNTVSVNFLNDAYGGSANTDRNLYVTGGSIDGTAIPNSSLVLLSAGSQPISFTEPAAAGASGKTGPDSIDLTLAEDAWGGDASFTVQVNGVQVGGVRTVTASHAAGISQDVVLSGNWGAGAQTVGISFINDAYGGTANTDRNLYVNAVSYDGQVATPGGAALYSNGTVQFQTKPTGAGTATLLLAAGSQGGAGYAVAVDGKTVIAQGTVPASGTAGLTQAVNLPGLLGAGWHDVAVSLLGAAAGGPGAGASLSIKGLALNNVTSAGSSALLTTPQTDHFAILV